MLDSSVVAALGIPVGGVLSPTRPPPPPAEERATGIKLGRRGGSPVGGLSFDGELDSPDASGQAEWRRMDYCGGRGQLKQLIG